MKLIKTALRKITGRKTNRDKCISQWKWMIKHSSLKHEWAKKHPKLAKELYAYHNCFACLVASNDCRICPVKWGSEGGNCEEWGSEYKRWTLHPTKENAKEVLNVVEKTWKE